MSFSEWQPFRSGLNFIVLTYLRLGSRRDGKFVSYEIQIVCNLTHWGRVTHICLSELIIFGLDNGLSPCPRQAIIWTNAEILLIGPLEIKSNDISVINQLFLFKKRHLKIPSSHWGPFCLGFIVLVVPTWSVFSIFTGDLGGSLGLYIGASFLTIYEIIDTCVCYFLRKPRSRK